jgi:GNAT superfamily N-acetyltransferase
MTFKSLEDISKEDIVATLNDAFSQYFVKINFTPTMLQEKFLEEDFNPKYSVGAFDGENLIGVILHGFRIINSEKWVYNMATGVRLSHRGKQLTKKMYQYVIPILKENDIFKMQLEVIQGNDKAIKVYKDVGFEEHCSYTCSKLSEEATTIQSLLFSGKQSIGDIETVDPVKINTMLDIEPSWSNNMTAIQNNQSQLRNIGYLLNDELIGYACLNPSTGRIKLMAVHPDYREQGIGKQILNYLKLNTDKPLSVINIDEKGQNVLQFLENNGFVPTVKQFELRMRM